MDDPGTVVDGAHVADIGLAQFLCPQACQQRREDYREIPFCPICLTFRVRAICDSLQQRADGGVGSALGSDRASFGRPTNAMGFAVSSSEVNRNVHSTFQVDQHRRIEAVSWSRA